MTALVGGPEDASEFAEWLLRAVAELGLADATPGRSRMRTVRDRSRTVRRTTTELRRTVGEELGSGGGHP